MLTDAELLGLEEHLERIRQERPESFKSVLERSTARMQELSEEGYDLATLDELPPVALPALDIMLDTLPRPEPRKLELPDNHPAPLDYRFIDKERSFEIGFKFRGKVTRGELLCYLRKLYLDAFTGGHLKP